MQHPDNIAGMKNDYNGTESQQNKLLKILKGNELGCDFYICLFIAALNSYRADSCLRPFPAKYVNCDNEKDFQLLRIVCDNIPHIKDIPNKCSSEVLDILTWLFIDKGGPVLSPCNIINLPEPVQNSIIPKPQYIFEVHYQNKIEKSWLERKNLQECFYAFHGSNIDNFYSILQVGLQQHFSTGKEVLFGNGIYLSHELSVCAHYAPFGETWSNSSLGSKYSCIALCEVINHVHKVKCKDDKIRERAKNLNSVGEIPEKYIVVTDSDMVRVRYLLVYEANKKTTIKSFVIKNLFLISLLLYFGMLIIIGFFNGPLYPKFLSYFQ